MKEKNSDILVQLKTILSQYRYEHSIRVAKMAADLASVYEVDNQIAYCSGLIHDCAKEISIEFLGIDFNSEEISLYQQYPEVWHSLVVKKVSCYFFGELPQEITQAATWHTTGRSNMTMLDKIIFVADFIEPGRKHMNKDEVREVAFKSLDKGVFLVAYYKLLYLLQQKRSIYTSLLDCYNFYIKIVK